MNDPFLINKRNKDIYDMRNEGATYENIATKYGVTRERVRQLYEKYKRKLNNIRNGDIYRRGFEDGYLKGKKERPKGEWIPVSERLPDDREDTYWVCTDGGYQCECRWTNFNPIWTSIKTDWHWCIFDILQYQKVVAWQPLPEPYKKGGAE